MVICGTEFHSIRLEEAFKSAGPMSYFTFKTEVQKG